MGYVPAAVPRVDWQQAVGLVEYDGANVWMGVVYIQNGRAVFRGQVLEGSERMADLRAATGWNY